MSFGFWPQSPPLVGCAFLGPQIVAEGPPPTCECGRCRVPGAGNCQEQLLVEALVP